MESPSLKLDDLAHSAGAEAAEAKGFMNPRRGRPKGSKNKEGAEAPKKDAPPPPGESIEAIKQILEPTFHMISEAGVKIAEDQQAAIGPKQMTILVNTGAACVNQYLPGALAAHANLIIFSVTFSQWALGVYLLRQANLAKMKEEVLRRKMNAANGRVDRPEDVILSGH